MATNYLYQAKDSVTGAVYHWTTATPGSGYPGPNTATEVALIATHGSDVVDGVTTVVSTTGNGLAPATTAAAAGRLLGFSGGAKTGAWVNPTSQRVYHVGSGYGMYGSITDAIVAINAGTLPTAGDRALILVWPGLWISSAPYAVPAHTTIRGMSRFDVVLQNSTTDLFHVNNSTVFSNFSVAGVDNTTIAAFDNNNTGAADVTINDVTMSGLTHCHQMFCDFAGTVWNGVFLRNCVVSSRRTSGYALEFNGSTNRNTSVYIEDCNFDSYDLTSAGGCVRYTAGNNNRMMRCRLRGSPNFTGVYLENNGQSAMTTRFVGCYIGADGFGGDGVGINAESGYDYHLINSDANGSTGAGTRTSYNSRPA